MAGQDRTPGSELPEPSDLTGRVKMLIKRGLEKYRSGDREGAVAEWDHALALEPGNVVAAEHIALVQKLSAQESSGSGLWSDRSAMDFAASPEFDLSAYDVLEIGDNKSSEVDQAKKQDVEAYISEVDEGWSVEDEDVHPPISVDNLGVGDETTTDLPSVRPGPVDEDLAAELSLFDAKTRAAPSVPSSALAAAFDKDDEKGEEDESELPVEPGRSGSFDTSKTRAKLMTIPAILSKKSLDEEEDAQRAAFTDKDTQGDIPSAIPGFKPLTMEDLKTNKPPAVQLPVLKMPDAFDLGKSPSGEIDLSAEDLAADLDVVASELADEDTDGSALHPGQLDNEEGLADQGDLAVASVLVLGLPADAAADLHATKATTTQETRDHDLSGLAKASLEDIGDLAEPPSAVPKPPDDTKDAKNKDAKDFSEGDGDAAEREFADGKETVGGVGKVEVLLPDEFDDSQATAGGIDPNPLDELDKLSEMSSIPQDAFALGLYDAALSSSRPDRGKDDSFELGKFDGAAEQNERPVIKSAPAPDIGISFKKAAGQSGAKKGERQSAASFKKAEERAAEERAADAEKPAEKSAAGAKKAAVASIADVKPAAEESPVNVKSKSATAEFKMDALAELSKGIDEPEADYAELSFGEELSDASQPVLSFDDDHTVETRAVPRGEIDRLFDESDKKRDAAQAQVDSQAVEKAPAILDAAAIRSLSEDMLAQIDASAAAGETTDQRIHRRISLLVERAQAENKIGNDAFSIVAMDLALDQEPDSASAQREIQEHRETLFQLYRKYLGNLSACPSLKVPMSELPLQTMDHRTGFLLSRVDGVLTLEDILDISGMTRLEAYRHLSRLVLQGILAVG